MPESRLSIERAASGWPALREVLARSRTCGDSLRGVAKKPDLRHITATELHPLVVGLDTIGLDPENERAHPRANLDRIKYSLRRFGVRGALSLRAGELVTKGNGTLQALRELAEERATGLWDGAPKGKLAWAHVPVLEFDDSPAAAAEYRVLDNRSGENAGWERGALEASFETFPDVDWSQAWTTAELAAEFEGWGADDEKPSGDGGGGGGGGPSEDEEPPIPEPPAEPITQFGDVIQIGPHTLHCADCMEVMRAMPDNSVDFIGTDPPYGLSPDGKARTINDARSLWRETGIRRIATAAKIARRRSTARSIRASSGHCACSPSASPSASSTSVTFVTLTCLHPWILRATISTERSGSPRFSRSSSSVVIADLGC